MWNPFSAIFRFFFPKLTLWGLMAPFVLPIIGTFLFFAMFTLIFRFFVRPYLLMMKYKKIKGAWLNYIPFLGSIWKFKQDEKKHGDFHYASKRHIQQHPDTRFLVSPFKDKVMVLLYDPELVKEFLSKEADFTFKDPRKSDIFHKSVKQSMSFASGEQWKSQREFISGVFNQEFVQNFIPTVQNIAKEWIGHSLKEESSAIDMSKKVRWFTAKVGAKLFFGEHSYSTPSEFKTFMNASIENQRLWMEIRNSPLRHIFGSKLHKLGLRSMDRKYRQQVKTLNNWYNDMLQKFKKGLEERKGTEGSTTKTLLEIILDQNTKSAENERMSDESIVGQMMTFFAAETSAMAAFLTSALYFLASHRSIQKKLRTEINESYNTNSVSFEMLSKMEYLNGFIKETFRLQTPTSLLYQRKVKETTTLLDVTLHKGDRVNVDILSMGYNPRLFENPTAFTPERWIEEKDPGVKERYAHLPFSEGAHKCPGKQLALTQSMIMLCELLKKFDLALEKQGPPNMGFDFVYHIKGPLNLTLTKV